MMSEMTATMTKSISLKPLGRHGTVRRHLVEEIPIVVPRYAVKPQASGEGDIGKHGPKVTRR